jgi:hypothetical protein
MRLLIALIIIIYLVGVGVVLSPTVRSTWDSAPASALAQSVAQGTAQRPRLAGQSRPRDHGVLSARPELRTGHRALHDSMIATARVQAAYQATDSEDSTSPNRTWSVHEISTGAAAFRQASHSAARVVPGPDCSATVESV